MSTAPPPTQNRRWYDAQPSVAQTVTVLQQLPESFQVILADSIVLLAEQQYEAHLLLGSMKSLGRDKVLALYKAKNRQRNMDANPCMFNAMNHLLVLSREQCDQLAREMLVLVQHVFDYFRFCRQSDVAVKKETVSEITNIYLARGPGEASRYLHHLKATIAPAIELGSSEGRRAGEAGNLSPLQSALALFKQQLAAQKEELAAQKDLAAKEDIQGDSEGLRVHQDQAKSSLGGG